MNGIEASVGTVLLNAIWQVALVGIAGSVAARLCRAAPARQRFVVLAAALVLASVLPWLAIAPRVGPRSLPSSTPLPSVLRTHAAEATGLTPPQATAGFAVDPRILRVTAAAWGIYLLHGIAAIAWSVWRARGIRRRSRPAPENSRTALRTLDVRVSDCVSVPVTVGVVRPVVVLPAWCADLPDGALLSAIVGHEAAHVRRRDAAVGLVLECIALPIAWHPCARWMKRDLFLAREQACDESVAEGLGALEYARALLDVARRALHAPRPASVLAAVDPRTLERRISALLVRCVDPRPGTARLAAIAVLLAGAGIVSSLFSLTAHAASGPTSARAAAPSEIVLSVWDPWADGYAYRPEGRRDPFSPRSSAPPVCPECRGLERFLIGEVALRGVVETPEKRVALLLAPDGRTYFASVGDRLRDGVLREIAPAASTFVRKELTSLARHVTKQVHEETRAQD
jgi:beta-lactamase regulating signal transducer with metallopeptidase domain